MNDERNAVAAMAGAALQKTCAQRFEYEQREERSNEIEGGRNSEYRGPAIGRHGKAGERH